MKIEAEDTLFRQQAWSVYSKHLNVLQSALRGVGRLGILDGMDLLHDFVVDRLPKALVSYNPQAGPIEPWLYAVFRRYVNRCLREEATARKGWLSLDLWEDAIPAKADTMEALSPDRLDRVEDALRELPDELRSALLAYFGRSPESGNERALARRLHVSRYRVRQTLLKALNDLAIRLGDKGFFSAKELRACRGCLVERRCWDDIAGGLGTTQEEAKSLVSNVLTTLGAALTQSAAPNVLSRSIAMDTDRVKFEQLVQAINTANKAELEDLRANWHEIIRFVSNHPKEADQAPIANDRRPTLILWLATPPSPEPIPWTDITGELSFVLDQRREQLALVRQLWDALLNGRILESLKVVLAEAGFKRRGDWLQNAETVFKHAQPMLASAAFATEDARLDVVAGYGAVVDQFLLKLGGPRSKSGIDVLGFESRPLLLLPDRTPVSCEDLGRAIAFRCGRLAEDREEAAISFDLLAAVVSLSLPAHPDVLPLVDVYLDNGHCQLVSSRPDGVANFLRE